MTPAATAERWPDPNRTLRRYVTEVLGWTLLDWGDDPWLDARLTGTAVVRWIRPGFGLSSSH